MNLQNLTDDNLVQQTKKLVQQEREILTNVLAHLREIERRRLFAKYRCSSLFSYCMEHLKYSADQAQRRISAMRLMREVPEVEAKIASGSLSLTNVARAKSVFQQVKCSQNEKRQTLQKLENKSTREGERILLALSPEPAKLQPERERAVTAELTELKFLVNNETLSKLQKLKGLLAHKLPNATNAELLDFLCEWGSQQLDPSQQKSKQRPKNIVKQSVAAAKVAKRKSIPITIKREVWRRAQGKCELCKSQYALELDHLLPVCKGGGNQVQNLRLLCRQCNQRAGIEKLGQKQMDRFIYR